MVVYVNFLILFLDEQFFYSKTWPTFSSFHLIFAPLCNARNFHSILFWNRMWLDLNMRLMRSEYGTMEVRYIVYFLYSQLYFHLVSTTPHVNGDSYRNLILSFPFSLWHCKSYGTIVFVGLSLQCLYLFFSIFMPALAGFYFFLFLSSLFCFMLLVLMLGNVHILQEAKRLLKSAENNLL